MDLGTKRLILDAAVGAAVLVFLVVTSRRRVLTILLSLTVVAALAVVAMGGMAILMNNVSLGENPGPAARIHRFLTVDWAATSKEGFASTTCEEMEQADAMSGPVVSGGKRSSSGAIRPASARNSGGAATADEARGFYPELVRHGYPGLSPARLFQVSDWTVGALGGWQVVKADQRSLTLDCVYTTRIFGWTDDVKIIVTPRSEVDVCSRSRLGAPGSGSLLRFFGGDFGANISHIEEFYVALRPGVEQGTIRGIGMIREAQIDALANYLVQGLVARGSIKPKADLKDLVACLVEMMSANFEEEARIEDQADQMAEVEARKHPAIDVDRLRVMIKQRLAQQKGFTL
jgi:hypothetical protein